MIKEDKFGGYIQNYSSCFRLRNTQLKISNQTEIENSKVSDYKIYFHFLLS